MKEIDISGIPSKDWQEYEILEAILKPGGDFKKIIEDNKIRPNIPFKSSPFDLNPEPEILVFEALKLGNIELVKYLINEKDAAVFIDYNGATNSLLHVAIEYGYLDFIKELVKEHNIDPNLTSCDYCMTPLELAVKHGRAQAINTLHELGANINQKVGDQEDQTLLHFASFGDKKVSASDVVETIKALVACGIPVDVTDGEGTTPLMHVAAHSSMLAPSISLHSIKTLIALGANIDKTDAAGKNFLQNLTALGSDLILAMIVMNHLDVNYILKSKVLEDKKTVDRMLKKLESADLNTLKEVFPLVEKFESAADKERIQYSRYQHPDLYYSQPAKGVLLAFSRGISKIKDIKFDDLEKLIYNPKSPDYSTIFKITKSSNDSTINPKKRKLPSPDSLEESLQEFEKCLQKLDYKPQEISLSPLGGFYPPTMEGWEKLKELGVVEDA